MSARTIFAIAFVTLVGCNLFVAADPNAISCPNGATLCKRRSVGPNGVVSNPTSLPNCAPSDTFIVSVVVASNHLWMKFQPSSPANPACETYIFDSEQWTDPATGKGYSVGSLQSLSEMFQDQPSARQALLGDGYVFGSVTGAKLLEAVHVFDGKLEGEYDVISNNCASKLIDVLIFVGLQSSINEAALEWVSSHLNTGRLVGMMRGANNLVRLFPDLTRQQILAKSDSELVSHLVRWYTTREIASYRTTLEFYQTSSNA